MPKKKNQRGSSPTTTQAAPATQPTSTPPPPSAPQAEDKETGVGYAFEFQILDEKSNVKDTQKVKAKGKTEAEAMERAVQKLKVPEGCTHRYTGKFTRND